MVQYCRDQARNELWLMMGGGVAAGAIGGVPILGAVAFQTGLTAVQIAVVTRIAQVYDVDLIPAGGAGAIAGAIMVMGGSQLLFRLGGGVAGVIPIIGGLIQPGIGAGAVKAFGEAAIAYFEKMYPDKIYSY
ncbi:hypothetical protein PN478_14005 [Dolichospermum circinale CS-534/05]|jgi:uncharacterized protein (DUF697 family)|uniref:hypothetical protein n=1 Tax=Dolichospermum circinale TaxID=109265 RepID=UPI00232FB4D9|nr:hypothetical protein [Dolichospermum circinale]MDB9453085.1 hypothetical protein [Dolichospermum circinale CS-541/06]MDB9464267.1 hypothetical protein [Dolichospermum circinale CS-541/04]MDB9491628.1 hypothetical protein [Dolichospermum circinale CS-534/05]MDB9546977.1 hypothetical protein [Dolichospermum circinale CS-1031]